jgi:nucleotide-binding universal stress UspA family protein
MKRILVPFDHSPAGEATVELVAHIARSAGSRVRVVSVRPIPRDLVDDNDRVVVSADQEMARIEARELDSLRVAEALLGGVPVESVVRFGDPAREVLAESEAWQAELVVLPAGERTWRGPGRLERKIRRKANVPVLVYDPSAKRGARPPSVVGWR